MQDRSSFFTRSPGGVRSGRAWARSGHVRRASSVLALAAVIAGVTACEPQPPPPPPPVITVNTTVAGADVNPGDGTCEATAGGGNCTLQAAIGEANTLERADIVVPAGVYPAFNPTITGNIWINWGAPRDVHVAGRWTVAAGGVLVVEGLSRSATGNTTHPAQIRNFLPASFGILVHGNLVARSLSLFGDYSWSGALDVSWTGNAVVTDSQVQAVMTGGFELAYAIHNAGRLRLDDVVAFHPYAGGLSGATCQSGDFVCLGPSTALYAEVDSQTDVSNSVIARVPKLDSTCSGSANEPWVAPFDCEAWNYQPSCVGSVNLLGGNRIADIVVPGACDTTVDIPAGSTGLPVLPAVATWVSSIPNGCSTFLVAPVAGCFPEWWTFTG